MLLARLLNLVAPLTPIFPIITHSFVLAHFKTLVFTISLPSVCCHVQFSEPVRTARCCHHKVLARTESKVTVLKVRLRSAHCAQSTLSLRTLLTHSALTRTHHHTLWWTDNTTTGHLSESSGGATCTTKTCRRSAVHHSGPGAASVADCAISAAKEQL